MMSVARIEDTNQKPGDDVTVSEWSEAITGEERCTEPIEGIIIECGKFFPVDGEEGDFWYWWLVLVDHSALYVGFPGLPIALGVDAAEGDDLLALVCEIGQML